MRQRRTWASLLAAGTLLVAAAGCGGDEAVDPAAEPADPLGQAAHVLQREADLTEAVVSDIVRKLASARTPEQLARAVEQGKGDVAERADAVAAADPVAGLEDEQGRLEEALRALGDDLGEVSRLAQDGDVSAEIERLEELDSLQEARAAAEALGEGVASVP